MSLRTQLLGLALATSTALAGLGGTASAASTHSTIPQTPTGCDAASCPPGFTYAATEGDQVNISGGPVDVAFGNDGLFLYVYDQRTSIPCLSDEFGSDPDPNVVKVCSWRSATGSTLNLLANGDAEAGPGTTSSAVCVDAPGWYGNDGPTVVQYGSVGFPSRAGRGPNHRGVNFFAGGPTNQTGHSSWGQWISLAPFAGAINGGHVTYQESGWFGGYGNQRDTADMYVIWFDSNWNAITAPIVSPGHVTPSQRHNKTALLYRAGSGVVPRNAAHGMVVLEFWRYAGTYNDGYADNVAVTLTGV